MGATHTMTLFSPHFHAEFVLTVCDCAIYGNHWRKVEKVEFQKVEITGDGVKKLKL